MKKHLVLVGGGHAHLTALMKLRDYLDKGHRVTLLSPSAYHYYSGMSPGMLSGFYESAEIRFNIRKMAESRGASFLEDPVIRIDPAKRTLMLKSGAEVRYDVVSFNIGSGIRKDDIALSGGNVFPVKPIENLLRAREYILDVFKNRPAHILIAGGGPAGLEISAGKLVPSDLYPSTTPSNISLMESFSFIYCKRLLNRLDFFNNDLPNQETACFLYTMPRSG